MNRGGGLVTLNFHVSHYANKSIEIPPQTNHNKKRVCENEDFIDTRPPPTGTPSNLEGEWELPLNFHVNHYANKSI